MTDEANAAAAAPTGVRKARGMLVRLLAQEFTERELRDFVGELPDGDELFVLLPGSHLASPTDLAHALVDAAGPRGMLDDEFFRILLQRRSKLSARINDIRQRCLVAAEPPGTVSPGTILRAGRYEIEEFIDRGGFASVWRALDRQGGKRVAIKVLHRDMRDHELRRQQFIRGASRLATIEKHPRIAGVIEAHFHEMGLDFCVLDLVAGKSLAHLLRMQQLQDLQAIVTIILDIGAGLFSLHPRNFHGDVSPKNIIINADGHATLVDFDLVGGIDEPPMTQATGLPGTDPYASPEWRTRSETIDARTDIFSLGMTAVQAFYGERNLPTGLNDIRSGGGPGPFIENHLSCDPAIKRVLTQACALEISKRYTSVTQFCDELSAATSSSRIIPPVVSSPVKHPLATAEPPAPAQPWRPGAQQPLHTVMRLPWTTERPSIPVPSFSTAQRPSATPQSSPSAEHSDAVLRSPATPQRRPVPPQERSEAPSHTRPEASATLARFAPLQKRPPGSVARSQLAPVLAPASPAVLPISSLHRDPEETELAGHPNIHREQPKETIPTGHKLSRRLPAIIVELTVVVIAITAIWQFDGRKRAALSSPEFIRPSEPVDDGLTIEESKQAHEAIRTLAGSDEALARLQKTIDDPGRSIRATAQARLDQAEILTMRALARQMASNLDADARGNHRQRQAEQDLASADALLKMVDPVFAPERYPRVQALQALAQGIAPASSVTASDEIAALVQGAPLWRAEVNKPPSGLITTLQRLPAPSSLARSVLALALWRSGDDEGARTHLRAILEQAADHPFATALLAELGEPIAPGTPTEITQPLPETQPMPEQISRSESGAQKPKPKQVSTPELAPPREREPSASQQTHDDLRKNLRVIGEKLGKECLAKEGGGDAHTPVQIVTLWIDIDRHGKILQASPVGASRSTSEANCLDLALRGQQFTQSEGDAQAFVETFEF